MNPLHCRPADRGVRGSCHLHRRSSPAMPSSRLTAVGGSGTRGTRAGRLARAVAMLACIAAAVAPPLAATARSQDATRPDEPGLQIQQDDPFADELNPFGAGKAAGAAKPAPGSPSKPAPATPPAATPKPPQKPSSVPLPRPSSGAGQSVPAAEPTGKALARPRLRDMPVPFPEESDDGDARDRRSERDGRRPSSRDRGGDDTGRLRRFRDDLDDTGLDGMGGDDGAAPYSEEAEKLLVKAEEQEKAGRFAEARDTLREVVKLDPSLALGHLALGVVLRRLGDFRGSVDALTKGIALEPEEPELYLRRGIAWFHLGLYGIALEDFEEAAGLSYDDPRPEMWRGLTLVELDRPLEAINAYAASIRRDRSYMLAYLNRGLVYLATNEPSKAEFDFGQAIRHKPEDPRAWFNRGVAQARQGRYREAVDSYEHVLRIKPGDQAARQNLEAARRMTSATDRRAGR